MNQPSGQPIAIVGIAAILPQAPDVETFWANLREGRYSITDVPPERWDPALYYSADPQAPDKTYSRIGGWVSEFPWDPLGWRLPVPPKVAAQMDLGQQWAVSAARTALLDAGWPTWDIDADRVGVILGNALGGEKHYRSNLRIEYPEFERELVDSPSFQALTESVREAVRDETSKLFHSKFFEITEDTMPGELANVIAGRVASVLGLRGPNFTTDAACASGLAAMSVAAQALNAGDVDAVVTGGVDRNMGVAAFVKFCKIGALSATGTRPFDAGADGFVMGEGAAVFVLKRLADAERDGDRVYAVLLGIGGASDGKGKGITAPNPVGQRLAVERAWSNAGADPASATMCEAHGTSTRVGDATELESLTAVFGAAPQGSIALGSVKSNIGHLKAAAGAAGMLKAVLSLHHRELPPSLHFNTPNPNVDWSTCPFAVNTELRDWVVPAGTPRRAGVSAFGFGGTNFHAVLEEYVPGRYTDQSSHSHASAPVAAQVTSPVPHGPKAPLRGALVLGGTDEDDIAGQLDAVITQASAGRAPAPAAPDPALADAAIRLAIDFGDPDELAKRATRARAALASGSAGAWKALRAQGVFLGSGPAPTVAFLYTGQGSQYVNMLEELRVAEPVVASAFDAADRVMTPLLGRPLTSYVFGGHDADALAQMEQQLLQTEITQPAVLTADAALAALLGEYGVRPDMVIGHSLGEYGALVAAGALSFDAALEAVSARGREMASLSLEDNGAMAAVMAPLPEIERVVSSVDGYVVVANVNATKSAVIGGATLAVEAAIAAFEAEGYTAIRIPVSHAFHSSIVAPACEPLRRTLARLDLHAPTLPVVSDVTGEFYPADADTATMLDLLCRQVASPVQFVQGLRTLYAAGARLFVEVGPKKALHGFAEDVLGAVHDDVAVLYTNHPKLGDIPSFNQALCGLYAAGLGYGQRPVEASRLDRPETPARSETTTPTTEQEAIAMTNDRYAELGHLFADFLEQGRRIVQDEPTQTAAPAPGAPPRPVDEPVVITGAGIGLPGVEHVFDDMNVARILSGESFIDAVPRRLRERMADMSITRLVKRESGDPTFETIDSVEDVIKLAARHGALDGVTDLGIEPERDPALDETTRLAIGAGFEALRDAGIPLVLRYRTTSVGTQLPDRWSLPESMRDDTGIVFASAFPGLDAFAADLDRYHEDRNRHQLLAALTAVRARLSGDEPAAAEVDRRIREVRTELAEDPFLFDRRFLFKCLSMGHSQFAELIGARGPNTQVNSACASTTLGIGVAEDWIRTGRARRVLVISADDATSDHLLPWIGSGFLASGAAATDATVEEAALPFDRRRHGMLIGMGAAALVVESADAARERGIAPICEVLATVVANSAFHGSRLDVDHIGSVMEQLMRLAEARGANRSEIAPRTVFVSHETYTPARGGSASAEINALRRVFGADADRVVITNTKGFTGHAMGAGIEDVVAVKSLESSVVPPVANFREVDPDLGALNLSHGGEYPVDHALRLAAGFGSQIAMSLLRWVPTADRRHRSPGELGFAYRVTDEAAWKRWLDTAAGHVGAQLQVVQRRLRVVDVGATQTSPGTVAATLAAPVPQVVEAVPQPVAAAVASVASVAPAPAEAVDEVTEAVVSIVAGMTGYPTDLLDVDLDLEADLGVDTVKQAEIFAAVRERFGVERDDSVALRDFPTLAHVIGWVNSKNPPTVTAPAAAAPAVTVPAAAVPAAAAAPIEQPRDEVTEAVVSIVAGMTGYPTDLLDVDLDLEADLGVDTVKQAEIFAAVRERFGVERDDSVALRDFPTLAHVIGWVNSKNPPAVTAPAAAAPAVTVPAAAVPAAAAAAIEQPRDEVTEAVVSIVAGMTGYPTDLLDVDLDLEADLGVDTVKQAEIFAAVRERFEVERDDSVALRDFPTLAHVIGWINGRTAPAQETTPSGPASSQPADAEDLSTDATSAVVRRVPTPVLRPPLEVCKPTGVVLDDQARIVVMPDAGRAGNELVQRLQARGVSTLVLERDAATDTSVAKVEQWLADGPVHGVYWLPALDDEGDLAAMTFDEWHEAIRVRVKNLYAVVRALDAHAPFLVAATRLGGLHGYDRAGATAPLGGAVTGFAKAYGREHPATSVKTVDFAAASPADVVAAALVDETLLDPGCVEVGYADGLRWTVGLTEQPFGTEGRRLDADSVFLVSGAAGSIVSAITADLAAAYGGTFHLIDLTPAPDPDDPMLVRYGEDRDGLKRDIAAQLKERGERPTPVLIERELDGWERRQAAQAAIDAVRSAGGTAYYHCVDLTDPDSVATVMRTVRESSGRVDVLLHAAGLEVSRSLADKEPAEFDRVFDVKADGWFNLMRGAGDLPIGTTVAFSSVAGRFGNAGQTDYSAANDLLCKLASSWRRTRPGTAAYALDWTAWGGIGMASRGSIPKIMEMAGIEVLPPEAGIGWIRRELVGGTPGEVVVARALGTMTAEYDETGGVHQGAFVAAAAGPMIGTLERAGVHCGVVVHTRLDPVEQPFLADHRIDGTPVLPGVMAMEAFAEVARLVAPTRQVVSVEDVRFDAPLKFYRDEPRTLTLRAFVRRDDSTGDLLADCVLEADRVLPGSDQPQRTTHSSATVRLSTERAHAAHDDRPTKEADVSVQARDVYAVFFHGPAYQVVGSAWRYDGGDVAALAADLPPDTHPAGMPTLTGPRLVELCFQAAGLWDIGREGRLALPLQVDRLEIVVDPTTVTGQVFAFAHSEGGGFDCVAVDEDGAPLVRVYGYRTVDLPDPVPDALRAPIATAMSD